MSSERGWFDRWFAQPLDPIRLGAVRICCSLIAIHWIYWGGRLYGSTRQLALIPAELRHPVGIVELFFAACGGVPSDALLDAIRVVLTIGFVLLAIGLYTRWLTWLIVPVSLAYLGTNTSLGEIYSLNASFYLLLLVGMFCDWGASLSVDALRRGSPAPPSPEFGVPLRLIHALAGLLFLSAGLHKIIEEPKWVTDNQLWRYLVEFNSEPTARASVVRIWLIAHPTLIWLSDLATVVFECSFFLTFFFPRLIVPYVLAALSFHIGIYLTFPAVIGTTFLPIYLAMLPLERLRRTAVPIATSGPSRSGLGARIFVGAFLGLELVAALAYRTSLGPWQRRLWPFNAMIMFSWRTQAKEAGRIRLVYVDEQGKRTILDPRRVFHPEIGGSLPLFSSFNVLEPINDEVADRGIIAAAARYRCAQGWEPGKLVVERWSWPYAQLAHTFPFPTPSKIEVLRTLPLPGTCP